MNYRNIFYAILCLLMLGSCGTTTKITGTWKADPQKVWQFKNIAVIAIANKAEVRKMAEAAIEDKLIADGFKATGALEFFPPNATKGSMSKELVIEWLKSYKVDAVLTISLLKKETEVTGSAGVGVGVYGAPGYAGYNQSFGDYYNTVSGYAYMPAYYSTSTNVYLQVNLFTFPDQKAIWIAETQTMDITSIEGATTQLAKAIVEQLIKDRVIEP